MDVSENSGFSPLIIHFNKVFHYKPSILGYPYFWKHPHLVFQSRKKTSGQRIHACFKKLHLSNEKKDVFRVFSGIILPSCVGITINHFSGSLSNNQDSMESKGFWVCFVAHLTKRNLRSKHLASQQARENVRSLANGRPWVAG